MKLLIKFPTRGRPVWFIKTLDKYLRMLSGKHEVEFMIAMDVDDETMRNDVMADYLGYLSEVQPDYVTITWYWKEHKGKVDAVNSCISHREFDIVLVISEDIEPQEHGYDDIIVRDMTSVFPDLNGIIYYNDSRNAIPHRRNKGRIAITIPILGKSIYTKLGFIVHPAFLSWGDNYSTLLYNEAGGVKYFPKILLKHMWRRYGVDAVYERAAAHRTIDFRTYQRLRRTLKNSIQESNV